MPETFDVLQKFGGSKSKRTDKGLPIGGERQPIMSRVVLFTEF